VTDYDSTGSRLLSFGDTTGPLLPTGRVRDEIDGIEVACVDNGMPVVPTRVDVDGIAFPRA
jgi:2-methylaconitate cis-trans-isomerase PrpF